MSVKLAHSYTMEGEAKLERDLQIAEAMATLMPDYLQSDVLYYPMPHSDTYPRLTLGGFLMREQRLRGMGSELDEQTRERLLTVQDHFQNAVVGKVVRVEQKADAELRARIKQWQAHIRELTEAHDTYAAYYPASVEVRVMIEALLELMRHGPYELDPALEGEVAELDEQLRGRWSEGDFVWPPEWQVAYPKDQYWFLYGQPAPAAQDQTTSEA